MPTKYPNVKVHLVGMDGNAFSILGRCSSAAKKAGVSKEEIDAFMKEATAGDYDALLRTCMTWFNCSGSGDEDEEDDFDDDEVYDDDDDYDDEDDDAFEDEYYYDDEEEDDEDDE